MATQNSQPRDGDKGLTAAVTIETSSSHTTTGSPPNKHTLAAASAVHKATKANADCIQRTTAMAASENGQFA
jgi:hypothetical protein